MRAWTAAAAVVGLVLGGVATVADPPDAVAQPQLQVEVLAVGYGNANVYRGPCGEIGVVDVAAGASDQVLAALDRLGSRGLSWIAVANYRDEHVGGVVDLATASGVTVGAVHDRGGGRDAYDSDAYRRYHDWVTGSGLRRPVDVGDVLTLCSGADEVRFTVLWATPDGTGPGGIQVPDERDRSLCLKVEHGDFDLASCGDAAGTRGDGGERTAVGTAVAPAFGDVEVAIANHHGETTTSTNTYMLALDPKIAVLSTGPGSNAAFYGMAGWRGGDVYITNRHFPDGAAVDGDVVITTDGATGVIAVGSLSLLRTDALLDESDPLQLPACMARHAGSDRVATSVEIAREHSGGTLALARADVFADALAAATAAPVGYVVVLTPPDHLDPRAAAEVRRRASAGVVLLGGPEAISPAVEDAVRQSGAEVTRVSGDDRFDTAAQLATPETGTRADLVVIANGVEGWPDALTAGPLARHVRSPLLLVARDHAPEPTLDAMRRLQAKRAWIVGGPEVISEATADQLADPDGDGTREVQVSRIGGDDRYDTAALVADRMADIDPHAFAAPDAVRRRPTVATGNDWPDALAAGPGTLVIILVDGTGTIDANLDRLTRQDLISLTILGGPAAVDDGVVWQMASGASCDHESIEIVAVDPGTGRDLEEDGEHVELRSFAPHDIDVGGWMLDTDAGFDDGIVIPEGYVIPPGGTLRVYSGSGYNSSDRFYADRDQPLWDDHGDALLGYPIIKHPGWITVHSFQY